jgi:hypothetical protein
MNLKTIAEEAADCRTAFAGVKVGSPVWLVHHTILCELLTEPAEDRIAYILSDKPEGEQARRLREFRPMSNVCATAWAEYDKVRTNVWAEYEKVRDTPCAEYWRACRTALAELDKVRVTDFAEFHRLHMAEYPNSTWNGNTIFPKGNG